MKTKAVALAQTLNEHSELLILSDGKILAHNITPEMAEILSELNPADEAMNRRADQKQLNNELPS